MYRSLPLLLLSFSAVVSAFPYPSPDSLSRQQSLLRKRAQPPELRSTSRRTRNTRCQNSTQFANPKAADFFVDGTTIPEVDFDAGDSWAGLLPISSNPNETRKLFFWYYPPTTQGNEDDVIFWTNGGPSCSSLGGFLEENGPISWQPGQAKPTPNPYSWTNLGHMLWVEQPVGTGFSQGTPDIHDETELAAELVGFLGVFLDIFAELKGKNFYLTGESYAGMYLPYIADYIYSKPTLLDLNLEGLWLASPVLTDRVTVQDIPAVNFVNNNLNLFAFNSSFLTSLRETAERCNYTSYLENFLMYPPPPAPFPSPGTSVEAEPECDVWTQIVNAAVLVNPAFDMYRISATPPVLWDVLGLPGSFPQIQVEPVYFNRPDVKAAVHAPADVQWTECNFDSPGSVFVGPEGDTSPPPVWEVLPRVLNHGARTVIVSGELDFRVPSEGVRLVLQNMTWGQPGQQGFQNAPLDDSFILDDLGAFGTVQSERGLTLYVLPLTGHMVPEFNPPAAFQSMQFLLGNRTTP